MSKGRWKKGQSGNPGGRYSEKLIADAMRIAACEEDPVTGKRKLRLACEKIVNKAVEGDLQAFALMADRIDGKPAQENTLTIDDKRDATDWTRDELVAFLDDATARRDGASATNGSGGGSDSVH